MPLGGGQRVGASCYYLRLGNSNIILDAGTGSKNGIVYTPVLSSLNILPSFYSMNQINHIYISHAHIDHTGYLIDLISQASNASVYMTDVTKSLTELQIYDRIYFGRRKIREENRLKAQADLDKITLVSYMKTLSFPEYKVTFYPAGHIPGAMMMLFEYNNRRILYTGDYSIDPSPLSPACFDLQGKNIDTVIMCGLHAKHPNYRKNSDKIYDQVFEALNFVGRYGKSVQCSISQLSKGIEFLQVLNENNKNNIPIFIERNIMQVINKLESLGIRVITIDNKQMTDIQPDYPHILLTSEQTTRSFFYSKKINADFTLHEDFSQMKKFIEGINPKQVVLVHCASPYDNNDMTIEQEILMNSDCNTKFIFAEEQEVYNL